MLYLLNAFSLQMLNLEQKQKVEIAPLTKEKVSEILRGNDFTSAIGHPDTASALSEELGFDVKMNRINISLTNNDILIVAQLTGGRLPEGSTTLPEGFSFKFVKVTLRSC